MTMYLTLDLFKRSVTIEDDTSDEEILIRVEDANDQINVLLKPYAETIPLPAGDPSVPYARQAALEYAKHLWAEYTFQLDKARYHLEVYQIKAEKLVAEVRADRPPRTQSVMVNTDPRTEKLLIQGQRDTFILDVF